MAKHPLILTLRVGADVDRSEFEPNAVWGATDSPSEVYVVQFVKKDGGYLVGATETYRESMTDIVSDTDRFVALVVDANVYE